VIKDENNATLKKPQHTTTPFNTVAESCKSWITAPKLKNITINSYHEETQVSRYCNTLACNYRGFSFLGDILAVAATVDQKTVRSVANVYLHCLQTDSCQTVILLWKIADILHEKHFFRKKINGVVEKN